MGSQLAKEQNLTVTIARDASVADNSRAGASKVGIRSAAQSKFWVSAAKPNARAPKPMLLSNSSTRQSTHSQARVSQG
jgi:hypothetical protein